MRRELVIAEPSIGADAAAWIRANVLTRTPSQRRGRKWDGPDLGGPEEEPFRLIDACRCQWGECGNCKILGWHEECTTRRQQIVTNGRETHLISSRGGYALASVWLKGVYDGTVQGCRWHCPCETCEQIGAAPAWAKDLPPVQPKRWKGTVEAVMF